MPRALDLRRPQIWQPTPNMVDAGCPRLTAGPRRPSAGFTRLPGLPGLPGPDAPRVRFRDRVPRGPFLALGRAGRKRHVDIRSGHLGSPLVDSPWRSGSRSRSYRSARRGRVAPRARVGSAPERGRAVLRTLPYTAQTVGRVRPTPSVYISYAYKEALPEPQVAQQGRAEELARAPRRSRMSCTTSSCSSAAAHRVATSALSHFARRWHASSARPRAEYSTTH